MSLHHQVDNYCERTDFTFWSEPLNAVSNIAFIIAGIFAWYLYRNNLSSNGRKDIYAMIMVGLMMCIGVGSFLFHTMATQWAAIADVAPIGLIIFTYHIATMHKVAKWPLLICIPSLMVFPALGWVVYQFEILNIMGSTKAYLPVIPVLALYLFYYKGREFWTMIATICVFAMSMTTRIIDDHICEIFPHGIHWAWHFLNGLTLYLAFRAYVCHRAKT